MGNENDMDQRMVVSRNKRRTIVPRNKRRTIVSRNKRRTIVSRNKRRTIVPRNKRNWDYGDVFKAKYPNQEFYKLTSILLTHLAFF